MRAQALGAGLVAPSPSALPVFALHRPATLAEAADLVTAYPDATIAAGCTDLVAQFREGAAPARVISVRRLRELQQTSHADAVLRLGSGVTHHRGSTDPLVRRVIPGLAAAWGQIATVRVRYSATLGGNLLARRYRYELSQLLGALGATLEFADGTIRPVGWLWDGAGPSPGLLTGVAVGTGALRWFGYERSLRPLTTVALAVRGGGEGSGAAVTLTAVVGAEYHAPVTLTRDCPLAALADPALAAETAAALAAGLPDSVGDVAGSDGYRRHVAGVLVRRLLARAAEGPPAEGPPAEGPPVEGARP